MTFPFESTVIFAALASFEAAHVTSDGSGQPSRSTVFPRKTNVSPGRSSFFEGRASSLAGGPGAAQDEVGFGSSLGGGGGVGAGAAGEERRAQDERTESHRMIP